MNFAFRVSDVFEDIKRVLGGCSDAEIYSRINHAIEILACEADWDPLLGYVDLCVSDGCVVLPPEVETVLAVNVCGHPAQGHDWLASYHLNGSGNGQLLAWHWQAQRDTAVFRYPHAAGSRLVTQLERSSDSGKNFRVFGYAAGGGWIRTLEGGVWVDGFLVPLQYGSSNYNPNAPLITRVERIEKAETDGYVRLYAQLSDGTDRYRIGTYRPQDIDPSFRLIKITDSGCGCNFVTVAFKKRTEEVSSLNDLIPLHSKYALVLACKALKKMDEDRLDEAISYQQMAVQLLTKKQLSVSPPVAPSIQIASGNLIAGGGRMD